MVEEYLNQAFSELSGILPNGWEKVVLYADVEPKHYNIFFYILINKEYVQCYNLDKVCKVSEDEIDDVIETWAKTATDNKKSEEWKNYTVIIDKDGTFKIDYSYEDFDSLEKWKKQYLI